MEHGLGNRGSAVCALFFVQRFALLPGTPLEAQLRRDPPARLVRVNGTVVREKAGSASAWSSCAGPSPSASRNHAAVQKRPPHAAASAPACCRRAEHGASAPASRNHSVHVHEGPPHAWASTNSNASSSPVARHITNVCRQHQGGAPSAVRPSVGPAEARGSRTRRASLAARGKSWTPARAGRLSTHAALSAFTEQHDEQHDQGHDEQLTIKDTIKNTINNTINNTTDREGCREEWGGEAMGGRVQTKIQKKKVGSGERVGCVPKN